MSDTAKALNTLISVLHDGAAFYETAAEKVDDPQLKRLFGKMQTIRTDAVVALAPYVQREGKGIADDGTIGGSMRQVYTKALSMLGDADKAYIRQLEENEDRTLEAFSEAADDVEAPDVRTLLHEQRQIFERTHQQMKMLKEAA